MKVSQLAEVLNTTPDTVRHYTKTGLLQPIKDKNNGYMFYNIQQQQRLAFILTARRLGFSIKDITSIFHETDKNNPACPLVRDIIERRLVEVEQTFFAAQALMKVMRQAINEWQEMPDKTPSSHSICHLIESFGMTQSERLSAKQAASGNDNNGVNHASK